MKHKAAILFLLLIIGCGGKAMKVREPSSVIKGINSGTVALVMKGNLEDVHSAFCTGVWVGENLIMTAHHCVQAVANEIVEGGVVEGVKVKYIVEREVEGLGEEPSAIHYGEVVAEDVDHDLALIKASGKMIPEHTVVRVAEVMPGVGERLHFVGHVKGIYWTYVEGVVSGYRESVFSHKHGPWLQVSAPVYFGNSGGGAFTESGELVGIASFIVRAPNVAFYVHRDHIKRMIVEYGKMK